MRTVNEIIYGKRSHERTIEENMVFTDTYKESVEKDSEIDKMIRREVYDVYGRHPKNLGETARAEILGNLGIFLSQFSDRVLTGIEAERVRRAKFRPVYEEFPQNCKTS